LDRLRNNDVTVAELDALEKEFEKNHANQDYAEGLFKSYPESNYDKEDIIEKLGTGEIDRD
jgi:hypothetical protein